MDINTVMYSPVWSDRFKPFDFDPAEHKTAKAAATAFIRRQNSRRQRPQPDIVRLLSPIVLV